MLASARPVLRALAVALTLLIGSWGSGAPLAWGAQPATDAVAVPSGAAVACDAGRCQEEGGPPSAGCAAGCICQAVVRAAATDIAASSRRPRADRIALPSGAARPPDAGPPRR